MKTFTHILILIIVALIALSVTFALYRPDILEAFWLWIVGLIGPIIALLRGGLRWITKIFRKND